MTVGKTKVCSKCRQELDLSEFHKNSLRKDGYNNYCKSCKKVIDRKCYLKSFFKYACNRARYHAKEYKVNYDLDEIYLESIWDGNCAIYQTPIKKGVQQKSPHAPELDRIIPSLGYTKGNCAWVSSKANRIKADGDYIDHLLIAGYLLEHESKTRRRAA